MLIGLHQFSSQCLNFLTQSGANKVDLEVIAEITRFRQEFSATALLNQLETLIHLSFESQVQHSISLIYDHVLQATQADVLRVLQVIQESAWRAHEDCDTFPQSCFLFLRVLTTHNSGADHVCKHLRGQPLQLDIDLGAEFSGWTKNDAIGTVVTTDLLCLHGVD